MPSGTDSTAETRAARRLRRRRREGDRHLVWVSVTGVVAIVMFFFLLIAGLVRFSNVVEKLNTLAEAQDAQRSEQLRSSCLQQNDSVQRLRDTFSESVGVVRPPPPPNPLVEQFISAYTAKVNTTLRFRDCSPSGIDAYFKNPPPAGAANCVPDGKGFCMPDTGG